MQNDNFENHEILDDDIMQCRADILRSRKRSKDILPSDQASKEKPLSDNDATAQPAPAENGIRIPHFEELRASQDQVVEALWETPEKTEPETETQISQTEFVDQSDPQQIPAQTGFDLDPENIVTAEEEQALFDEPQTNDTEIEETAQQGLDDLRKVIEQAKIQAQTQIDELDDIEEIMAGDDIEKVCEEKDINDEADIPDETCEIMNVNDLLETDQDREEILQQEIQQNSDDKLTSGTIDENNNEDDSEPDKNIPEFDLAEKILKEQRQVASRRRQRPTAPRNLNVMPIAGTVGRIIEQAKKAVAAAAEKKQSQPQKAAVPAPNKIVEVENVSEKPDDFGTAQVAEITRQDIEPELSIAACRIINESDMLNPFQEDIIVDIVSKDIAKYYGELTASC